MVGYLLIFLPNSCQHVYTWTQLHLRHARSYFNGPADSPNHTLPNFAAAGDITCLFCFASYKQITAIMLLPSFPGVLAPLRFNPVRFEEFASFAATLCGTWVGVALLLGAYSRESTSGAF